MRPPAKPSAAPGTEPRRRPSDDDGDEQEVGRAARDRDRGDDDDLQHGRNEEDTDRAQAFGGGHRGRSDGRSTMTASSAPKSTYGSTWTCWKRSVSVWPTLVTSPIGIPLG